MAVTAGTVVLPVIPGTTAFPGLLKRQLGTGAAAGAMRGVGLGIGALIGAGIAGGLAAFNLGKTFDDAFDVIRVGTGATGKALEGLKGDFRAVFRSVPTDTKSAATAIADLNTRLGLTGRPLREVSRRVLELSRLTGEDLNAVIPATTRLIGDWGIKTGQMPATLDKLYRASQATGIGVQDLSRLMVQFGSPLRQLGFSFDFSAAMFSNFEKAGVATATLMPGLRFALKNLSKPTDELAQTMRRLGIDIEDGPDKALAGIFKAIKAAPSDLEANQLAFTVFGQRAGPDMAAAIREGKFEIDDLQKQIKGGSDTILKAAKDTRDWRESWKIVVNNGMLLFEPVATRVFGAVADFGEWLVNTGLPGFRRFSNLWAGLGKEGGIQRFAQGLDDLLGGGGRFTGFIENVATGIQKIREEFNNGAGAVAPGGPLGRAFTAIREFIGTIWPPIVRTVRAGIDAVVAVFRTVSGFFVGVWQRVGGRLIEIGKSFLGALAQTIRGGIDVFRGIFDVVVAIFTGDWKRAWEGFKRIVAGGWNVVQGIFRAAWQVVAAIVRTGLAVIQTLWSGAWTRIWNSIKSFWKVVDRLWRAGWRGVGNIVKAEFRLIMRLVTGAWRGIVRFLTSGLRALTRLWTAAWRAISRALQAAWDVMRRLVARAWDRIRNFLMTALRRNLVFWRDMWRRIFDVLRDRWNAMRDLIRDRLSAIRSRFDSWRSNLATAWRNFWSGIFDRARDIWNRLRDLWRDRTEALRDRVAWLIERVRTIWNRIANLFRNPINWVIRVVWNNGIVKAWNFIANRVGFGTLREVGQLPTFQRGGPVGGTGRGDRIPALLEPGEFVVNRRSTSRHRALLELLNRGREGPEDGLVNLLRMRIGGIVEAGRAIQRMGYSVGEHPAFGGVAPVHTSGSYHYRGQAIDVNWRRGGSEAARLDQLRAWILQNVVRANIRELIWRAPGHRTHLHLAMSGGGGGSFISGIAQALVSLWGNVKDRVLGMVGGIRDRISDFMQGGTPFARLAGRAGRFLTTKALGYIRDKAQEHLIGGGGGSGGGGPVRNVVQAVARTFGWGRGAQWNALTNLITRESGWRPTAQNPTSTAFGLFQFLNSTWAGTGIAKTSNPRLQTIAGLRYIRSRHRSPIGAWNFWQRNHWYDDGGWLPPGISISHNDTGQPERVLAPGQVDSLSARLGAADLANALTPYALRPGDKVQFVIEGEPLTATVRKVNASAKRSFRQVVRAGG